MNKSGVGSLRIISLLLNLFLIQFIFAQDEIIQPKSLIGISLADPEDRLKLIESGLDIWEIYDNNLIIYASELQIQEIQKKNYPVDILYATGDDYLKSLTHYKFDIKDTSGLYHSYSEITHELTLLVNTYPDIATSFSIGTSIEGRDLYTVKISNNPTIDNGKPAILITGCHHAREWISVEIPFYLAKDLMESYSINTLIQTLFQESQIYIIPVVNPDGLVFSQLSSGATWRLWRKNRRNNGNGTYGVDLNRNYSYEWGTIGASPNPGDETYRGIAPFSEPETQAIRDFCNNQSIWAAINFHSYSELILYPWGYTYTQSPDHDELHSHATIMQNLIYSVNGKNYTAQQASLLYPAAGDSDDWMYGINSTRAYTIELRPKTWSEGGFILPENQIQPTFFENLPAIYYLIESIIEEQTDIPHWMDYITHR